jgi:hypothetical protein
VITSTWHWPPATLLLAAMIMMLLLMMNGIAARCVTRLL